MTDETFEAKLAELRARIDALPAERRADFLPLLQETRRRHHELTETMSRAYAALDDWRIALKYALFNSEAIQRERQG